MMFNPVSTLERLQPNAVSDFGIIAQVLDSMCLGLWSLPISVARRRSIVPGACSGFSYPFPPLPLFSNRDPLVMQVRLLYINDPVTCPRSLQGDQPALNDDILCIQSPAPSIHIPMKSTPYWYSDEVSQQQWAGHVTHKSPWRPVHWIEAWPPFSDQIPPGHLRCRWGYWILMNQSRDLEVSKYSTCLLWGMGVYQVLSADSQYWKLQDVSSIQTPHSNEVVNSLWGINPLSCNQQILLFLGFVVYVINLVYLAAGRSHVLTLESIDDVINQRQSGLKAYIK